MCNLRTAFWRFFYLYCFIWLIISTLKLSRTQGNHSRKKKTNIQVTQEFRQCKTAIDAKQQGLCYLNVSLSLANIYEFCFVFTPPALGQPVWTVAWHSVSLLATCELHQIADKSPHSDTSLYTYLWYLLVLRNGFTLFFHGTFHHWELAWGCSLSCAASIREDTALHHLPPVAMLADPAARRSGWQRYQ